MKIRVRTVILFVGIMLAHALVLSRMGRRFWCACGELALWKGEAWSSHTSQHLLDPYSFSHIQHGILFFFVFYLLKVQPRIGFWGACLTEIAWEILENSAFIINRYRSATAALDYFGDSIINSEGDILCCLFGFVLALRLPWRVTLGLFLAMEFGMLIFVRDSLSLNVLMLITPIEAIRQWQLGGAV